MSAALTHHQTKPHSLMDDIESCFWVLLHISRYNSHFNSHIHTTRSFCSMFEEWGSNQDIDSITYHPDDTAIGGTEKRDFFQKRRFPKDMMTFDSRLKPLGDLIQKLRMYFRELYWTSTMTTDSEFEDPEKLFEIQQRKAEHAEEILDIFDKALALDSWDVDSDSDDDEDDEVSGNDGLGVEDRRPTSRSAGRSMKTTKTTNTRKSFKSSREGQISRQVNPTPRVSKKRIREEVDDVCYNQRGYLFSFLFLHNTELLRTI
ncbi:hypothetical protein C8Q75DRAFT_790081 [Abortiporus biennis]|nr:hypothetical protein C8Q75DRAFT_790081 [Abortiporus biennis]